MQSIMRKQTNNKQARNRDKTQPFRQHTKFPGTKIVTVQSKMFKKFKIKKFKISLVS